MDRWNWVFCISPLHIWALHPTAGATEGFYPSQKGLIILYNEFEMRRLDSKEYEEIRKGFVPDAIFEENLQNIMSADNRAFF